MHRATRAFVVGLLLSGLTGCAAGRLARQLQAEQKENADLRSLNETLTAQLTTARGDVERLQAELDKRRPAPPAGRQPGPALSGRPGRAGAAIEPKRAELASALAKSGVAVDVRGDALVLVAPITFEPGKATLTAHGRALLDRIGKAIAHDCPGYEIGVAGYTDSTAITKAATKRLYPTNWHLSGFRALAAMQYLIEHCHISPARLHFRGYGQYHPLDLRHTAVAHEKNRRIEIFLEPPR